MEMRHNWHIYAPALWPKCYMISADISKPQLTTFAYNHKENLPTATRSLGRVTSFTDHLIGEIFSSPYGDNTSGDSEFYVYIIMMSLQHYRKNRQNQKTKPKQKKLNKTPNIKTTMKTPNNCPRIGTEKKTL